MGKAGTYQDTDEYKEARLAMFVRPMRRTQHVNRWTTNYKSTYWVADISRINRLKKIVHRPLQQSKYRRQFVQT